MANETELSNIAHATNVVSQGITPYLVNPVVVGPLIRYEPLPVGTNVKLFRKDGYLIAEEVNESAVFAIDAAGQELTQTSVTATAVKLVSNVCLSVEAQQFSSLTLNDLARYAGEAIARDWDDEILGLFSGFSGQVTATSTLTIADCLTAAYTVRSGTAGVSSGRLITVLDYKGMMEIEKELTASGAAHLANPSEISLLSGNRQPNGYRGSKAGMDFYETSGLPTSSSDDVALCYDPNLAFGGMISTQPQVRLRWLGGTGDGTRALCDEVCAWIFCDIIEWNDAGGVGILSDT